MRTAFPLILLTACAAAPEETPARCAERGYLRWEAGDAAGAIAEFTRAIELAPDDPAGYWSRAVVYRELQDYSAALADYTAALERGATEAYWYRAGVYDELGLHEKARADYARYVEVGEDSERVALSAERCTSNPPATPR